MTIIASRRGFITGLVSLIAAPAIVRASSIMPVKQMIWGADDIARMLDARLDAFEGEHDQRLFKRYSGYEAVEFDANAFGWKTPEQCAEESRVLAREQLFDLKNSSWKKYDANYEAMKARWARSHSA